MFRKVFAIVSIASLLVVSPALGQTVACPGKFKSRKLIESAIQAKVSEALKSSIKALKVRAKVQVKDISKVSKPLSPEMFGFSVTTTYAAPTQELKSPTLTIAIADSQVLAEVCEITAGVSLKVTGVTNDTAQARVSLSPKVDSFKFRVPLALAGKVSK